MSNKYTVIKLTTGDDIIGVLGKSKYDDSVMVHNPLLVVSVIAETGVCVIYLRKYMTLSSEDHVYVNRDTIITSYTPSESLVRYYDTMLTYINKHIEPELEKGVTAATEILSKSIDKPLTKEIVDEKTGVSLKRSGKKIVH